MSKRKRVAITDVIEAVLYPILEPIADACGDAVSYCLRKLFPRISDTAEFVSVWLITTGPILWGLAFLLYFTGYDHWLIASSPFVAYWIGMPIVHVIATPIIERRVAELAEQRKRERLARTRTPINHERNNNGQQPQDRHHADRKEHVRPQR